MLRLLFWFALFYIVWKIARAFIAPPRKEEPAREQGRQFSDVEDAEFEDLTEKPPPTEPSPHQPQR